MSKIKLVLTDIDGTLVWHAQYSLSEAVKQSLEKVDSSGVEIVVATGRPYAMMAEIFENVNFKGLGIFDAGASIRDVKSGESIWQNWLDIDRVQAIANILMPVSSLIDCWPEFKQLPPQEISLKDINQAAPYVFSFFNKEAEEEIVEKLSQIPDITWHIHKHRQDTPFYDIQVTDIKSDKFHAVKVLREISHSNKTETLAIGDSSNDIPLFKTAGVKVAMGNAIEELKQKADYVVGSVDEDGFAEAMDRFVLV